MNERVKEGMAGQAAAAPAAATTEAAAGLSFITIKHSPLHHCNPSLQPPSPRKIYLFCFVVIVNKAELSKGRGSKKEKRERVGGSE